MARGVIYFPVPMAISDVSPIDAQQLRRLFADHAAGLAVYARQWCLHPDDAVQEALIQLISQRPPPRDPVAWLFTTVRRRALNQARSEQRRNQHQQRAAGCREPWFEPDPAAELAAGELEAMLDRLDPLDREIVVARIWGELAFEQIAALVQRSTSLVHRRYHHALGILHCKLNPTATNTERPS